MDYKKANKVFKMVLVSFVVLIGVVLLVNTAKNNKTAKSNKTEIGSEKETSYYMAQKIIKQQLKVPGSAKFQNYYENVDVKYSAEKDEYYLRFWAEAKNSFGVSIRENYYVVIKKVGEKEWKITDMMKN